MSDTRIQIIGGSGKIFLILQTDKGWIGTDLWYEAFPEEIGGLGYKAGQGKDFKKLCDSLVEQEKGNDWKKV